MSYKITTKDLERQHSQYVSALKDLGMLPEGYRIVLEHGSKTYGRAFRIALTGCAVWNEETQRYDYPNGSGHSYPPTGDDYLGMTKAEAYRTLNAITRTLWAVKNHQDRVRHPEAMSYETTYPEYPGPGSGEPVTITHNEPSTVHSHEALTSCCDTHYWYSDVTAKGVLVDVVMTCAPKTAGGCGRAFWGMH